MNMDIIVQLDVALCVIGAAILVWLASRGGMK